MSIGKFIGEAIDFFWQKSSVVKIMLISYSVFGPIGVIHKNQILFKLFLKKYFDVRSCSVSKLIRYLLRLESKFLPEI